MDGHAVRTVAGKWTLALTALAAVAGGCQAPSYVEPGRLQRGLVVVLPGIEGTSAFNAMVCQGLAQGHIEYAIEIYDWTGHWNPMLNLQDEATNRHEAGVLAGHIAAYQKAYPGRPVFLVGQSGGGAIALWTAEAMPEGQAIEGIVLLAASISPKYRLEKALANSRRGIVSFYSGSDWVFLSVGTKVFTTMDGQHSESAGRDGFASPGTGAYQKLYQIGWDSSMVSAGNIGLHLTSGAEEFVQYYVAPLILCGRWDSQVTGRLARGEWIDPRQYPALANPPLAAPAATGAEAPPARPVKANEPPQPAPVSKPAIKDGELPAEEG